LENYNSHSIKICKSQDNWPWKNCKKLVEFGNNVEYKIVDLYIYETNIYLIYIKNEINIKKTT